MKTIQKTTILEQISKNPALVAELLKDKDRPQYQYICNLILNSSTTAARRDTDWEYKSLLAYGEEDFCRGATFRAMYGSPNEPLAAWHEQAAKALGYEVLRNVIYEDEEGLVLFVRAGAGYRPAKAGDPSYDFVKRLLADGNLQDIGIDKPVSWAGELFVNKRNLDAYACIWFDLDYLSKPGREELKRVRREAVWRETLRLMSREPYASSKVPAPTEWTDSSASGASGDVGVKELGTRERSTYLNAIGVLLELVLEHYGDKQEAVIGTINERHPGKGGLSRSNLERLFPAARVHLTRSD